MSDDLPTIADAGQTDSPIGSATRPDGSIAPGTLVGRYLVIDEVGRGGMGVVVRAYDPRLQREVALKLLRTQAMSERARARMVREARAMAKLNHRNVVAVYDVEIDPQSVVLAMELIAGTTLRKWTAEDQAWGDVLDVVIEAGHGLSAAHRAGLLHRDFKPGNVLVADSSGPGVPRVCVTDFGLARASQSSTSAPPLPESPARPDPDSAGVESLSEQATLTVAGTVVGTPAYMAPEQHAGKELTAAADQYAFCLATWEALCGERPFIASSARALMKLKRGGPPKWPAPAGVPSAVSAALRRGLSPAPEDRWPSMDALLSALSKVRGRAARRTGPLVVLGMLAAGGSIALAGQARGEAPCLGATAAIADAWGPAVRASTEASVRQASPSLGATVWANIGPALDQYAGAWTTMHRQTCEATAVHGSQSDSVLDLRMGCLARIKTELSATTRRLAAADADIVAHAHEMVDALPAMSRCEDIEALTAAVAPPPQSVAADVARLRTAIAAAVADQRAGRVRESVAALQPLSESVDATEYPPLHAEWATALGPALLAASRPREAEPVLRAALRATLSTGQWDEAARAATSLTGVLRELARPAEGMVVAETAWGVVARTSEPEVFEASLRAELGAIFRHRADYQAAETELRSVVDLRTSALGPDSAGVAQARMHLANVLRDRGEHDAARAEYEAALSGLSDTLGARHPAVAAAHVSFGSFYARTGDFDEARQHTELAIEIAGESLGEDSHRLGSAYANLGGLLGRQGKLAEAEEAQRKAIAIWEAELGPEHPDVVMERGNNLAQTLMSLGRFDEAEVLVRPALESIIAAFGAGHPRVAMLQMCLAGILDGTDRSAAAEPYVRSALTSRIAALGGEHMLVAHTRINLGSNLVHQGRWTEAEPVMRAGLEALIAVVSDAHPTVAMTRGNLAEVLVELGRGDDARALLQLAVTGYRNALGPEHPSTRSASARLSALSPANNPDLARP